MKFEKLGPAVRRFVCVCICVYIYTYIYIYNVRHYWSLEYSEGFIFVLRALGSGAGPRVRCLRGEEGGICAAIQG